MVMRDSDLRCCGSRTRDDASISPGETAARIYPPYLGLKSVVRTNCRGFVCPQPGCGRPFSSKCKMMRHMLIHSGERQFKCSICERCFHRKDHLKNHLQVHDPNKTVHSCDQCGKKYSSFLSYRKHLALHAAESGDLSCKLCGKTFPDKAEIMYHLKVHSGSRTIKGPNERKFKCEQCDRSFFTRKDVRRHMVVHTGLRNFVCELCPQRFGRKDHLVRHLKKSHGGSVLPSNSSPRSSTIPDPSKVDRQGCVSQLPDVSPCSSSQKNYPEIRNPLDSSLGSVKPDPGVSAPSYDAAVVTPGVATLIPSEQSDVLKVGDLIPLPVPEYITLASAMNSGMPPFFTNTCYIGQVGVGSSNVLPIPSQGMLPPISGTSLTPFPSSTDGNTPSLPHFNQAF